MPIAKISIDEVDEQTFNFIIVGGGTSGCFIASRLAKELTECRVLLLEAGGEAQDEDLIPGLTKPRFANMETNWMFKPANNFMAWVRGPKVDYDDWASLTGDPWWKWDNALERMKKLEDFRPQIPKGQENYATVTPEAHSTGGPFAVGYGTEWQPLIGHCMLAGEEAGHQINKDNNDGDLEGISIAQFNVDNGCRVTSTTAHLDPNSKLETLIIATNALASRLVIEKRQVIGVEILSMKSNGADRTRKVFARREVILTAGCFQSPQLLLLSGIGPKEDLEALNIPIVMDLPVGQNLQDHSALACEFIIDPSIPGHNQLLNDPDALGAAENQYQTSKTGPLAMFGASASIIFPKLSRLHSTPEFASLPPETKDFLKAKGRPSTKIWMHSGPLFYTGPCPPDASVLVIEGLCQNNLSRGSLKLASTNPREFPLIDPGYLKHPYDVQIAIETVREILKLAETKAFSSIIQSILLGPRSSTSQEVLSSSSGIDDATIEEFVRETLTQGFHSMSTCVMGKDEDGNKFVSKDFRILGLGGLRVADMSVCPILTCNHTQINAYLIGERCAELIVSDYTGISTSRS